MEKEESIRKRGGEKKKIWHKQQEKVLKEWSEIGASYRYMHDRAYTMYNAQNLRFALPVIIIPQLQVLLILHKVHFLLLGRLTYH